MGGAQQPSSCALARASWVAMVPSCHPHGLRWCPHAILALRRRSWARLHDAMVEGVPLDDEALRVRG